MATRQRRPLLQVEMGRSMLPDRRQKHKWNATSCSQKTKLGILHPEKNACLHFLPLFMAQKVIGKRHPLLQVETGRLMLPKRCWKCKLNVTSCSWQAKLNTLDTEKNYLLAIFNFVHGAEGDEATSPSFPSRHKSIDASRMSLEAQMERAFMQLEGKVGHFAHGKKLAACAFYLCSWCRGRRGNVALFCI